VRGERATGPSPSHLLLLTSYLSPLESCVLEIKDLRASAGDKEILRGRLARGAEGRGARHHGPNGSGKSTSPQVTGGAPSVRGDRGQALFEGRICWSFEPEERAQAGLFLAFQYTGRDPWRETNAYFLRAAYNELRKAVGSRKWIHRLLDVLEANSDGRLGARDH